MKKFFALLLAAVMCLALVSCGNNPSGNTNQEEADTSRHAQEFKELLCSSEWYCRGGDSILYFSQDGTVHFHYGNTEEDGNHTWQYSSYLNSFSEYQAAIQHDPEFSDSYGVYIGSMEHYGQILLGCNDDGSYKMYFNGKLWDHTAPVETSALYSPYVGKWVCDENYWVVVNEDGTLIYNGETFTPEYIEIYGGIGAVVKNATYTYLGGTETYTGTGCVFI